MKEFFTSVIATSATYDHSESNSNARTTDVDYSLIGKSAWWTLQLLGKLVVLLLSGRRRCNLCSINSCVSYDHLCIIRVHRVVGKWGTVVIRILRGYWILKNSRFESFKYRAIQSSMLKWFGKYERPKFRRIRKFSTYARSTMNRYCKC